MSLPAGFKSAEISYTLSMADLKKHFAVQLSCNESQLTIIPIMCIVSDYMDRDTHTECDGLKIVKKEL